MANHWLKVPDCKGEAVGVHADDIDIQSWNWGVQHPVHMPGESMGEASAHELSVVKRIDKATPTLIGHCVSGKPLDEVVLFARKQAGDGKDYLQITLKKAIITSVTPSGSEASPGTETVRFSCSEVAFEYTPITDGKAGATSKASWNFREHGK